MLLSSIMAGCTTKIPVKHYHDWAYSKNTCPVRDKMLVEKSFHLSLQRAVRPDGTINATILEMSKKLPRGFPLVSSGGTLGVLSQGFSDSPPAVFSAEKKPSIKQIGRTFYKRQVINCKITYALTIPRPFFH
jgi:hypothetical protein